MKKILLTGGSGFFGSYLKPALENVGSVTTIGIADSDDVNINLANEIPELESEYDLVVHAAGKAHVVPHSDEEEKAFFDVNYRGTLNLLKGIEKGDRLPLQFVFISTVAVYGLETGNGIDEEALLKASDPYGKSKVMAEEVIRNWGEEKGVLITILRLPLLIGKNAPGNLGAMISAISKGRFAIISKGSAKRSMVFAGDVAGFIPEIASKGGVYNLTDGNHPDFKKIAQVIGYKLGVKPYIAIPELIALLLGVAGDMVQIVTKKELPFNSRKLKKMTSSLTFDDSKARSVGWSPSRVVDVVGEWL